MEPLNTIFRISPALLFQNFTTPCSKSSSSFSSPSFADHQTGLKVYCESPASLTSAHQDNPLFEGFPVLPASNRKAGKSRNEAVAGSSQAPGNSPNLQDQLHHLLTALQRALDLHGADVLPDNIAPQLADELEAVAKKLKMKEREVAVERQLRAKVHLALTGAEATIRKLRATPSRCTPESGLGVRWPCNEAAVTSPMTATAAGSRNVAQVGGPRRGGGGMRDSVCRQLLQSPSSSMSPLSCTGRSVATSTTMCVVDDASMASPKELPTELQGSQRCQLIAGASSTCEHVLIPTGILRSQQVSSPLSDTATSSSFHPPLYNWMKAVLASAAKQDGSMLRDCDTGGKMVGCVSDNSSGVQSPAPGGLVRSSPAAAIRAALSNTRTLPLVYGSPLYRRIQRLLADHRSPSPHQHDTSHTRTTLTCGDSAEEASVVDRRSECRASELPSTGPGPDWDREVETDQPSVSNRYSDTSSSCYTPITTAQDDFGALPFQSTVSPFGPTLRERYAARACTTASDICSVQQSVPADSAKAANVADACPLQREESPEAAALIAELGLDLQLDPFTNDSISNLEVLEHVERWAREQFIAAKRALEASKGSLLENEEVNEPSGSGDHPHVRTQPPSVIAIQTQSVGMRPAEKQGLSSSLHTVVPHGGKAQRTWQSRLNPATNAPGSVACVQFAGVFSDVESGRDVSVTDDASADICLLSRNDQLKRSPLPEGRRRDEAAVKKGFRQGSIIPACSSRLGFWGRKRSNATAVESTGHLPRRGLFRVMTSISSPGTEATDINSTAEDCGRSRLAVPPNHLLSPDTPTSSVLNDLGPSPRANVARLGLHDSAEPLSTMGAAHVARIGSQSYIGSRPHQAGNKPLGRMAPRRDTPREELQDEVLFTPGASTAGGSKTGKHMSRIFPPARSSGKGQTGDSEGVTPLAEMSSCSSSVRATVLPVEPATVGLSGEHRGSVSKGTPRWPAGPQSSRSEDSAEIAAEVLFTPGKSKPAAKSFGGKRVLVPFGLASAIRFEEETDGEEVEEGDASAKTLSSISSVSIIGSEPVIATNENNEEGQRSAKCSEPELVDETPRKTVNRRAALKQPFSQYLCGFFTSLIPCTHIREAR